MGGGWKDEQMVIRKDRVIVDIRRGTVLERDGQMDKQRDRQLDKWRYRQSDISMDIWRDGKIDKFDQVKRQKVVEKAQGRDVKKRWKEGEIGC